MTGHPISRARSSAGEHYLDMVGVTGSIPVAPTSLRLLRKLRLGKPASTPSWRSKRRLPRRSPKGEAGLHPHTRSHATARRADPLGHPAGPAIPADRQELRARSARQIFRAGSNIPPPLQKFLHLRFSHAQSPDADRPRRAFAAGVRQDCSNALRAARHRGAIPAAGRRAANAARRPVHSPLPVPAAARSRIVTRSAPIRSRHWPGLPWRSLPTPSRCHCCSG